MAFLTPLFLFALAAVSIPVAIHLIRREKPPIIAFSSLRFFQRSSRKQFLFQKFQQWLLLLLRALVVMLLVLAFARPFISQNISVWANRAPQSVAVLVDNSMSMAYGDYAQKARERAQTIFNSLGPGDEATLIVFADRVQRVYGPTQDVASLNSVLDVALTPGFAATRYFPALRLADEILAERGGTSARVHLISDFQASGMQGFDKSWRLSPGVDFVGEDLAKSGRRNLSITGLKLPELHGPQLEGEAFVRIRSTGSLRERTTELVLVIDDEEHFRQRVDLEDQSETVVKVPLKLSEAGRHHGSIRVADEHFTPDNTFYFTLDAAAKIPVLLVKGGLSGRWYEDDAHWFSLAVSGHEESPFVATVVESGAFWHEQLEQYQVAVLLNPPPLSAVQARALEEFVHVGGSLLLAPGARTEMENFNAQLEALSPAVLEQRGRLDGGDYLLIADVQSRHPALRPLGREWMARFTEFWSLKAHESAEVLMRFDNGEPALIERQPGKGRSMIFASSLDLEWNNLPLQNLYLPFIHETLKHLAGSQDKKPFYQLSEAIPLSGASQAQLFGPAGTALALTEDAESFTPQEPGIYRYDSGGQSQYYAANIPLEEADLSSIAPGLIHDQILHPETAPGVSQALQTQRLTLDLEQTQRLWWWLLLAAAALLLVESVVANRTYR